MSKAERIKQGGSAITYIIVGIVLAIGLIASIYFSRQRGEIARKDQAIVAYEENNENKNVNTSEENSNSTDKSNKADVISYTKEEENISTNDTSLYSELPQTGPGDILINSVILFILSSSFFAYFFSLRQ